MVTGPRHALPQYAVALALTALPLVEAAAQAPAGPRTRLICDIQRAQRLAFIDNPLAPAGINRKVAASDEAAIGRFELVFSPSGTDATMTVAAQIRDGGRPGSARMSRYAASEYTGFTGFDPEDGSTYVVTYFARINKAIWTIHSPRLDARDRAAVARSLFAECRREDLR